MVEAVYFGKKDSQVSLIPPSDYETHVTVSRA